MERAGVYLLMLIVNKYLFGQADLESSFVIVPEKETQGMVMPMIPPT